MSTIEDWSTDAVAALVELAARWTPDALAETLSQAMELAAWSGRDAVFLDEDDAAAFAVESVRQPFREQIDFLRQKRIKPTKYWLDALKGDHDRSFVVAGVTDTAMLEEFQAAIIDAAQNGKYVDDFAKDFDRLVAKYGWDYRGERNWRIRTIFETNIRTSFMAGRLRQMRDPDVVKLRPYWQYLHGDSRTPRVPRKLHLDWHGLVLMWDDPWWEKHFPPNDWFCSCGVRTLSRRDLTRLGKSGPDEAPIDALLPILDPGTGQMIMQPAGIGYGWDYMPGDLWERGLVPSALLEDPAATPSGDLRGRSIVRIDQPEPMADLLAKARPFKRSPMQPGLPPEDYVAEFMRAFGLDLGQAQLWQDAAGGHITISDQLFRSPNGRWKTEKRGHGDYAPLLAEAILDPDEIWLGVREVPDVRFPGVVDLMVTRRYVRVDPDTALFSMFEIGRRGWGGVTGYASFNRSKPDFRHIDTQRVGKLLWKRK
ncbi:PBECR2 nuclease fold domain-containing protein [Fuscovulum blasticum]|uniref:PBECR2 nuclease fold domain-containing protein n=1 Tax=Fuscovulum blasticum TaxID=1075 RepID=UPI000D3EDD93|nr:PBECR2 nuclease fold domain-containing protein [Fuscovulum blasticum]